MIAVFSGGNPLSCMLSAMTSANSQVYSGVQINGKNKPTCVLDMTGIGKFSYIDHPTYWPRAPRFLQFSGERSEFAAMQSQVRAVLMAWGQRDDLRQCVLPLIFSGLHKLRAGHNQTWLRERLEWRVLHRRFHHSTFSSPRSSSGVQINGRNKPTCSR